MMNKHHEELRDKIRILDDAVSPSALQSMVSLLENKETKWDKMSNVPGGSAIASTPDCSFYGYLSLSST
jgi:hypothetical protein